ncbi:MAG: hypothetical protein RMJ56_10355 [Gemmataceae bacterium]|nr:hypothetical protein [Gemmata sp.]MDW8197992.1 hypothetical protein [Gemmataceae bacterium]
MAIELRCPDCRAKLRLKAAPAPGTDIECPKCESVFTAPELEDEDDADSPPPPKKKTTHASAATKTADQKLDKPKPPPPRGPRKRRAKKKETSKLSLFLMIGAAVLMVSVMSGTLIWFYTRTPKAVEMFYYVPEDAQFAIGINLGHAQKYPKFYEQVKSSQEGTDFKIAGQAIAKAADTDFDTLIDYMVRADSLGHSSTIVFRTKEEFNGEALAKLPNATKKIAAGVTYYVAPNILPSNQTGIVFAPTNRLIVVCYRHLEGKPVFEKMLTGHANNRENTLGIRMGPLGEKITRGTFWQMTIYDNSVRPPSPPPPRTDPMPGGGGPGGVPQQLGDDTEEQFKRVQAEALNGAKGMGVKASLGSREVRFEIVVWHKDSDKASEYAKKMRESELGKGDEGEPPRWFKNKTQGLGDRKVAAQLLSNISFGSSGELFYAKSAVETVDMQQQAGTIILKVTGQSKEQAGGPPGMMPGTRRRRWIRPELARRSAATMASRPTRPRRRALPTAYSRKALDRTFGFPPPPAAAFSPPPAPRKSCE